MDSLINALKDTPIPTILVAAGIFFLLMAVAQQIGGKIILDPSRRKLSVGIGVLMILAGVTLNLLPRTLPFPTPSVPGENAQAAGKAQSENFSPITEGAKLPKQHQEPPNTSSGSDEKSQSSSALNDTIATAKQLMIGSTIHEKHKTATDRRYFRFSTTDKPPEKLRVLLRDLLTPTMTLPAMIVFDPDEKEIYNDYRSSGNLVFVFPPKPNTTYFILALQHPFSDTPPAEYDMVLAAE